MLEQGLNQTQHFQAGGRVVCQHFVEPTIHPLQNFAVADDKLMWTFGHKNYAMQAVVEILAGSDVV